MKPERFAFALKSIEPNQWAIFERFASSFLVFDYNQIRTVAAANGDKGRDSELFSPDGETSTLLQYSVTKSWKTKIKQTADRIRENFKDASILIYVTNQQIGADADDLKKELRKDYKLVLDIHDKNWFMDRLSINTERQKLVEKLAVEVADPIILSQGVIESKAPSLSKFEAKVAVLHLQMQWEDDSRDKGLTKVCFEAVVKSVLRGTTSENRMNRVQIHKTVQNLLSHHSLDAIRVHIDSALSRLEKRSVRHWKLEDEYCLAHEEVLRFRDALTLKEMKSRELDQELTNAINDHFDAPLTENLSALLCVRSRRILDAFLFRKGEEFAAAVTSGEAVGVNDDTLDQLVTDDFASRPDDTNLGAESILSVRTSLREILQRSSPAVRHYLREMADGYTLFGFLRATPDVQKVVQKVFRHGELWLDTSALLPVFAETLLPQEHQILSPLLRAAIDAGVKLKVTSGVIEEVERHFNRCLTYQVVPIGKWNGSVPFLYVMHSLSGQSSTSFANWVNEFCGRERPLDDIAEYLHTEWGIEIENLKDCVEATPQKLRWEVERIWREAHEARRKSGNVEYADYVIDKLVSHDVECFLGVLGKRNVGVASELGYSHWFVTFDKTVRDIEAKLKETLGSEAPKAPVMSPDFLASYLAVGPVRSQVSKASESSLPVFLSDMISDNVPAELLEIAETVRKECSAVNERLIRRRLRDTIDGFKKHRGAIAKGGFNALKERLEKAFTESKK